MKYNVLALTALASAVSAQAAPAPTGYFSVISARSASPVHLLPLQARGGKFYLGGSTSSFCPENIPASSCPAGNTTVLVGGDKTLSMGVVVPGGQEVYIGPDGAMSYTVAHSVFVPEGSVRDEFSREAPATPTTGFGYLHFETGFVACPSAGNATEYQVFGQVDGATFGSECLGFNMLTGTFPHSPFSDKHHLTIYS
jgi:hypothetical protein